VRLSEDLSRGRRRIGWACAVAAGALVMSPLTAAASPEHGSLRAAHGGAAGTVYGGVTAQDFPIVIVTSKNRRKVVKATIGIRLTCTSGASASVPDTFAALPVSKKRRFGASFGPETNRNDDGTTTDFEGSISGRFNKARTKVSGTWSFKATDHNAAGAITDTCDSGSVTWRAKQ
jgi:hypothetical protein